MEVDLPHSNRLDAEEKDAAEGETPEPASDYEPGPDAGPELDENASEEPADEGHDATVPVSEASADTFPAK